MAYLPIRNGFSISESTPEMEDIKSVSILFARIKASESISGTDSKVRLNTFLLDPSLSRNVPTKLIFTMSADDINSNSSSSKSISLLNFLIILLTIPIKICPDFEALIATK